MRDFKIKTYVPTLSCFGYVNELNNSDLLRVVKLINYKDDESLSSFLESFLDDKFKNNFDKAFGLLNLRSLCVGEKINVSVGDKGVNTTAKLSLTSIIKRMLEGEQKPIPCFKKESLEISFSLPKKIYYTNFADFLKDTVDNITFDNFSNYKNLTDKEKLEIISRLKTDIVYSIKEHLKTHQTQYRILMLNDDTSLSKSYFCFYDNSFYYFLKFLFKNKLSSTYNKIYHCSQKLNLQYSDFCKMTPSETDLLIAIYKSNNSIK